MEHLGLIKAVLLIKNSICSKQTSYLTIEGFTYAFQLY